MPPQVHPLNRRQGFAPRRLGKRIIGLGQSQRRAEPLPQPQPLIEQQRSLHPAGQPEKPEKQHYADRNTPKHPENRRCHDHQRQEPLHQYRQRGHDPGDGQNPTGLLEKQIHATANLNRPDLLMKCLRKRHGILSL